MKPTKELRRQLVHIIFGTLLLLAHHLGVVQWWGFFALLALSYVAIIFIHTNNVVNLEKPLRYFDREDAFIPGWGALSMIKGALIASLLFPSDIASALIAVLVFGDGFATLIGHYVGKHPLRCNPKKTLEGMLAGLAMACLTASLFLYWPLAIIAASVGMLVETLKKPAWLDDNFLIPIAGGLLVMLFLYA